MRDYVEVEGLKYKVDKGAIEHYNKFRWQKGENYLSSEIVVRKLNAIVLTCERSSTRKEGIYKVFCGKIKVTLDINSNTITHISCYGDEGEWFSKLFLSLDASQRLKEAYEMFGLNTLGNRLVTR